MSTDPVLACHPNSVVTSCNPKNSANNSQTVQIYNTTPSTIYVNKVAGVLCMPTSATLQKTIAPATSGFATKFEALAIGWKLILISIPIAILLSLVVMCFIRLFASCFLYILIFALVGVLVVFGIYVWTQPVGGYIGSTSLFNNNFARAAVSILSFLLAFAIVLFVCCYRSRISLAAKITEVAAVFVGQKCLVILVPLIMFGVTLALLVLWVAEALGFYSLGTPTNCTSHCYPFQHFNLSTSVYILLAVHVFYLLWIVFFMISASEFLIGGTATGWYFKQDSPYCDTSRRFLGKHMGSVCAGSFLLALIGFIKLVYTLLAPDPKQEHTGCVSCWHKFCDCLCCLCIGKLFDWLNTGAYTWINMAGDSYCHSAFEALALRIKNAAASGVLYVLSIVKIF